MIETIIKRDGSEEPFYASKVNGWSIWASKVLGEHVDWASGVMAAVGSLPTKTTSQELQDALIRYFLNKGTWANNRMAGRLYAASQHKVLYGKDHFPTIQALHKKLCDIGYMVPLPYSDEEYAYLNTLIVHTRDFDYAHSQIDQIRFKYSLRNHVTKEEYQTCQFVFMRMAMALGAGQPKDRRLEDVKCWYEFFSKNKINCPTPNYTNLGTKLNGYLSCCLINVADTALSLSVGDHIAYMMTVMSAGIGTNIQTRSIGDPVRGGLFEHRGKLPYYRALYGAIQANIKNGRNGACTVFFSAYDPENHDILRLKNPMTPADKQIRGLDYAILTNKFLGRKAAKKEDVFLFNIFTAPDLTEAFYSGDLNKFIEIYNLYENDPTFKKTYTSAREILIHSRNEAYETGRAYWADIGEINRNTPFKDPIYSSNLCVAPETMLLTDKGHLPIASLSGQTVRVWNGCEYNKSLVVKTGTQGLWTVTLSDGRYLDCTPYHIWYIVDDETSKLRKVRTHELKVGNQLIHLETPIVYGSMDLNRPYMNGFYSGSGCQLYNGYGRIDLHGDRQELKDQFEESLEWRTSDTSNSMEVEVHGLLPRFFVPHSGYSTVARLKWLAGWLDAVGSVDRSGTHENIIVSSFNLPFLEDVQYMLQTLSVNSEIYEGYRLSISVADTQKLLNLGLPVKHLKVEVLETQQNKANSTVVASISSYGRVDDTYCVNEPHLHMAVFNGILTGQCVEIVQPTQAYENMVDLYSDGGVGYIRFTTEDMNDITSPIERVYYADYRVRWADGRVNAAQNLKEGDTFYLDNGDLAKVKTILELKKEPEVSLCALAGIVLPNIEDDVEYEKAMYYALLMIDKCIPMNEYVLPHVGYTAKNRLNAGIGIMSLAHHMARKGLKYSTLEGKQEIHRVAERHMYYAIKASLRLGKELGNAPWIHRTKWVEGWTPLDTYNPNVDRIVGDMKNQYNWSQLKAEIIENKGIRNSALVAHMPGESSSKASGGFNSIYPARDLSLIKTDGHNKIYWTAPDSDTLSDQYEFAWDVPIKDQIEMYGIFQKWTDQSISADLFQRLLKDDKVSSDDMLQHVFMMYGVGMKTHYYTNSKVSENVELDKKEFVFEIIEPNRSEEPEELAGCVDGACSL